MSLTEHVYTSLTIQSPQVTLKTEGLINSGASVNFISVTFMQALSVTVLDLISPRIVSANELKISSSGNDYFYSLLIAVNERTLSTHIFCVIDSSHWMILGLSWLQTVNSIINWCIKKVIIEDQVEVTSAAVFLKEAKGSLIYIYYTDLKESGVSPEIFTVYQDFSDVFNEKAENILPLHWGELNHHIKLLLHITSSFRSLYNLSEQELAVLKNYIDKHLRSGFITHSKSSAASLILFVKKKNDSLQLCVNYWGLNVIFIKNKYFISLISEILNHLSHAWIFTKLNLWETYNLIQICKKDEWKTAFHTHYDSFKFKVMPFRLMNASVTFQSYIDWTLQSLLDEFIIVYLNDILIYSESESDHERHVRQVLDRLCESDLFIKLKKCAFHVRQVKYLRYIISPQGLSMNLTWVITVQDWPTSHSVKDVQSFLSFCNFYRHFIKGYSEMTHTLTELMKRITLFHWSEATEESFQNLKQAFQTAPLLAQFNSKESIFLKTDMSDYAVSDILSQCDSDMHWHSVTFFSHKLQSAECNYDTLNQELLTVVASFKVWRHYLEEAQHLIQMITDHHNLRYFLGIKPLTQRQAHWTEFLSGFNFSIKYQISFKNSADAPSWWADYHSAEPDDYTLILFFKLAAMSLCVMKVSEKEDSEDAALLLHIIVNDICSSLKTHDFQKTETVTSEMTWKDELLHLSEQLYISDNATLRLHILQAFHDSQTAEHLRWDKTLTSLHWWFYWSGMMLFVTQYVKSCDLCERTKSVRHRLYEELHSLPASGSPWTHIMIDFITDLLKSTDSIEGRQYDAVLVIVNRFSKMMHYILMIKDLNSMQFTWLLLREVVRLHHVSMIIISDWGTLFRSEFWNTLSRLLDTDYQLFTAFHPQTDSQTEHQNQTLEHYLQCFINYLQNDWVWHLLLAEHTYNSIIHSVMKVSSFFICTGWDSIPFQLHSVQLRKTSLAAAEMTKEICYLQEQLVSQISEAQDQQTKYYNKRHVQQTFTEKNQVWLREVHLCTDWLSKKLDHHRLSLFTIHQKISDQVYWLSLLKIMKVHSVFHVSLLKSYQVNELSGRVQALFPSVTVITEKEKTEEYEVEVILRTRLFYRNLQYLIWWKDYTEPDSVQWCSAEDVMNTAELMNQFHQDHLSLPQWSTKKKQSWRTLYCMQYISCSSSCIMWLYV